MMNKSKTINNFSGGFNVHPHQATDILQNNFMEPPPIQPTNLYDELGLSTKSKYKKEHEAV